MSGPALKVAVAVGGGVSTNKQTQHLSSVINAPRETKQVK